MGRIFFAGIDQSGIPDSKLTPWVPILWYFVKMLRQISINLSSHILAVYLSSLRCQPLIWLWAPKSKPDSMERMDGKARPISWNAVARVNLSLLDFDAKNQFSHQAHLKYSSTKLVRWASYFPQSTHLFCKADLYTFPQSIFTTNFASEKFLGSALTA